MEEFIQSVGGKVEPTEDPGLMEEAFAAVREMGTTFDSLQKEPLDDNVNVHMSPDEMVERIFSKLGEMRL